MAQILPLGDIYIEISQRLTWAQSHGALSTMCVWTHTISLQRVNKLKKPQMDKMGTIKQKEEIIYSSYALDE